MMLGLSFGWLGPNSEEMRARANEAAAMRAANIGKRFKCGPWSWTVQGFVPGSIIWVE